MRSHLLADSGGLTYHVRALRYRKSLWQPFAMQVARWLAAWQPAQRELVIIGPSAGYTLDACFLARFSRITILEPDPLARRLLARRFPAQHFERESLDCCAGIHGPAMLRARFPQAAFLFSNVLGQVVSQLDPRWPQALLEAMQGASWASYHDLVACSEAPARSGERHIKEDETLESLLADFWAPDAPQGTRRTLTLHDHGSFGVLPAQSCAVWSITPRQHHLVAWMSISVEGSSMTIPPMIGIGGRS